MLKLTPDNKQFPHNLLHIAQPPRELFIQTNAPEILTDSPVLAVVGSRKASPYGQAVTGQLVRAAASRGIVIVSGLALGVDALAHQAALEVGGKTIAILPAGLDNIYPSTNYGLAQQIVKRGGALVTEYPPKTKIAFKSNFIARNRLVAGIADALLITEAADKSGSLHTASFALEQGKEVLAVPGPITSPGSAGCNMLIKTGATPVTSADDIFAALKLQASAATDHAVLASTPAEHAILQHLMAGITDTQELQKASQLGASEFQQTLSMLEITGKIRPVGGGQWAIL